jgi:hypothetical protein
MPKTVTLRACTLTFVALGVGSAAPAGTASHSALVAEPASTLRHFRLPLNGVSFAYPADWRVTTRRLDSVIDPHTLFAVSSYPVPPGRDECDGTRARGRPSGGAFVIVKEVLDSASLRRSLPRLHTKPRSFRLPTSGRSNCLPPTSVVFQFRVGLRAFYVFVSVGPEASRATRGAVVSLLNGMRIVTRSR